MMVILEALLHRAFISGDGIQRLRAAVLPGSHAVRRQYPRCSAEVGM